MKNKSNSLSFVKENKMDQEKQKWLEKFTQRLEYQDQYNKVFVRRLDKSKNENCAVYYDTYRDECRCQFGHILVKGCDVSKCWINPPQGTRRICPGCHPEFRPLAPKPDQADPSKLYPVKFCDRDQVALICLNVSIYNEANRCYFFDDECFNTRTLEICDKYGGDFENVQVCLTAFIEWKCFTNKNCGLCGRKLIK